MPLLPEAAIPGGFALGIGHFISEISDYKQQQNPRALPHPPAFATPLPARNALCQNGSSYPSDI